MTASSPHSRMFYRGTEVEVHLGDRVLVKRFIFGWFRKPLRGVVCYIPGISPLHKHLEYEDVQQWAIRLDDGTILAAGYDPDNPSGYGQPSSSIMFASRGSGGELDPDESIDETWDRGAKEEEAE